VVFVSPSSPLPRDIEELKIIRENRKTPVLAFAIPVPDSAEHWSATQALDFIKKSSCAAIEIAAEKFGDLVDSTNLYEMVDGFEGAEGK